MWYLQFGVILAICANLYLLFYSLYNESGFIETFKRNWGLMLFVLIGVTLLWFPVVAIWLYGKYRHSELEKYVNKKVFKKYINKFAFILLLSLFAGTTCITVPKYEIKKPDKKIEYKEKATKYDKLKKSFPWLNEKIYKIIVAKSKKYKLDPILVCSVIEYESARACRIWIKKGKKYIVKYSLRKMQYVHSKSNAIGFMQIMPFHVKGSYKQLYNPWLNIEKGTWYYSLCLKKAKRLGYKNPIVEANRMYNSGLHGKRWRYSRKLWKGYAYPIYYTYKKAKKAVTI